MKIKKLNESSLVDKKVSTLGKDGKPMYFTADQLEDAKAKYPEYDFEETTIDKSLPQGQKAYIAKLKESKEIKVFGAKAKKLNEAEEILYVIKDSHGNQLSRPNPDDDELWDRVASMEARGRRGLCVVVYTGKKECLSEAEDVQYGVHSFSQDAIIFRGTEEECGRYIDSHKELWDDAEVYRMEPRDSHYKKMDESIDVATIADYITDHYEFDDIDDKYSCINSIRDSFKDEKTISWEELEQFIGAHNGRDKIEESVDTVTRYKVEYYAGDNDERLETYIYADSKEEVRKQLVAKTKSEGIDYVMITAMIPETVPASYKKNDITESTQDIYGVYFDQDGYEQLEFTGTNDECNKYISDIQAEQDDEFGDEAPERFIKRLTEDKGQPRSNRYTTYFNRIKKAIEKGDEETLQRTKEAIMYAPAKELKNSEASELMDMIKNRKINEASYGGSFDIGDDQYFTRDDLMSFADEVLGHVSETFNGLYDIGGVWFEDGHVITQIVNDSGDEYEDKTKVDMRKIREPWHLKRMYAFPVAANIIKQIGENDADVVTENIQGIGEYSDKFYAYLEFLQNESKQDNIAYLASELFRYCKEDDLKDLWFDRMNKVAQSVGFETGESIEEGIIDEFHTAQRYLDFEIPDTCKATADKLPNMTEQDMLAINKHCRRFKDVLDYYSIKSSSSGSELEERFDSDTHRIVAVALDVIAPVEMTESEIEVELTDAINKSKVEVSGGYMEINALDESLNEDIIDAEPIETGAAIGMAAVVSDLIKDEYEAIDGYNSAIATAEAEGFEDAVKVLTDIQAEENLHVGQLQELMKMFDANADKVDEGQAEAEEQINKSAETPNNNIEESADMKKERWEEIYDSFKTVEKELNQDGEAVTAVITQMCKDNKGDPDYSKAYDKWASNE